jgi:hypothetical protein
LSNGARVLAKKECWDSDTLIVTDSLTYRENVNGKGISLNGEGLCSIFDAGLFVPTRKIKFRPLRTIAELGILGGILEPYRNILGNCLSATADN